MRLMIAEIEEAARGLLSDATAGGARQYAFELMVDGEELLLAMKILRELRERIDGELEAEEAAERRFGWNDL